MKRIDIKNTAESVLRELPSVLGAHVSEDLEGRPREIHLLVRHGPDPANLARDIRGLLEERLGMPIDQRVISIAQLDDEPDGGGAEEERLRAPLPDDLPNVPEAPPELPDEAPERDASERRPVFAGMESTTIAGQVTVNVHLDWGGTASEGTADALDTQAGRARAAATAALRSATGAPGRQDLDFELDFASMVSALNGEYVLVSVLAISSRVGRRPLALVGAHPVESDVESAAALATLKAINRVITGYSSTSRERRAK